MVRTVAEDVEALGPGKAGVALKVIEPRIKNGERDKVVSPFRD